MEVDVDKNKANNCEIDLNNGENNDNEDKKEDLSGKQQETNPKKTSKQKVALEDFEIIGCLGNGSFGEVTLVKKKETDQMYAMKAINKSFLFKVKCYLYLK